MNEPASPNKPEADTADRHPENDKPDNAPASPAAPPPAPTNTAAAASSNSPAAASLPKIGKTIPAKKSTLLLMFFVFLVGVSLILWAWRLGPFHSSIEQTDNSYIKGQTTILSSQINGYIDSVYVNDFDHIVQGQQLLRISAANYAQQVVQAQSAQVQAENNLANQQQTIEQRKADIIAANAKVEQAQAQYQLARQQLQRYQQLANSGATSRSEYDTAQATLKNNLALLQQAQANVLVAKQALTTAEVAKVGLQAQRNSAGAQVQQAKTMQDYSLISAPVSGQLGPVNIHRGQYVSAGTQLLFVIPQQNWVIANFKETQINHMAPGQKAWFKVDALDGRRFTGTVERIAPAAGSEFSVIKADNATGNFTKVVQRISVRIRIDPNQPELNRLGPGMSVETFVDTGSK